MPSLTTSQLGNVTFRDSESFCDDSIDIRTFTNFVDLIVGETTIGTTMVNTDSIVSSSSPPNGRDISFGDSVGFRDETTWVRTGSDLFGLFISDFFSSSSMTFGVSDVLFDCASSEMLWIDTSGISTQVTNLTFPSFRRNPISQEQNNRMHTVPLPFVADLCVTSSVGNERMRNTFIGRVIHKVRDSFLQPTKSFTLTNMSSKWVSVSALSVVMALAQTSLMQWTNTVFDRALLFPQLMFVILVIVMTAHPLRQMGLITPFKTAFLVHPPSIAEVL